MGRHGTCWACVPLPITQLCMQEPSIRPPPPGAPAQLLKKVRENGGSGAWWEAVRKALLESLSFGMSRRPAHFTSRPAMGHVCSYVLDCRRPSKRRMRLQPCHWSSRSKGQRSGTARGLNLALPQRPPGASEGVGHTAELRPFWSQPARLHPTAPLCLLVPTSCAESSGKDSCGRHHCHLRHR
jgi:hypothetical protein